MVEMVKVHDLNVHGYLKFVLEHQLSENMTDEQLAELTLWSVKTPIYQKLHVNYSELLQLAKGLGNFISYCSIIGSLIHDGFLNFQLSQSDQD